jgi:cellobiose-specific phosphotransferase system component IIC
MATEPDQPTTTPDLVPESVAKGRSAKMPTIAIATMFVVIAIVFVIALGLAALAYAFAR